MAKIERVHAREILDSRGFPTVEAMVTLAGGAAGTAAVPSGASTGEREAVELRDGDPGRYAGKGVTRAVAQRERRARAGAGRAGGGSGARRRASCSRSTAPRTRRKLGANALLAVSLATARAAAAARGTPLYRALGGEAATLLPVPLMNVINGGRHADNNLDFQEFMIVPHGAPSFPEAMRQGVEVYHALKRPADTAHADHRGRRRGRLRARAREPRAGARPARGGDPRGGPRARTRRRARARLRGQRARRRRRLRLPEGRRPTAVGRGPDRALRALVRALSRSSRSRTASARTTAPAGRRSPRRSAAACSSSATTSSAPTRSSSPRASPTVSPTRS